MKSVAGTGIVSTLREFIKWSDIKPFSPGSTNWLMLFITVFASTTMAVMPGIARLTLIRHDLGHIGGRTYLEAHDRCLSFFVGLPNDKNGTSHGLDLTDLSINFLYLVEAFLGTAVLCMALNRLFHRFSMVYIIWDRFGSLIDPVESSKRRRSTMCLGTTLRDDVRASEPLAGYLDVRHPGNAAAWTKIRYFMLLRTTDDLKGVAFVLGFVVLFVLVAAVSAVGLWIWASPPSSRTSEIVQYNLGVTKVMLTTLAFVLLFPLLLVVRNGAAVNDALAEHPKMLTRAIYEVQEEFSLSFDFAHGKSRLPPSEAAMMIHSRRILSDTVRLLQTSDRAIEVFGIPLSSRVFQLVLIAGITNIASVLLRNSIGSD